MDDTGGERPERDDERREPPTPPAALLLDVDGVVVDTEGRWAAAERRLMDRAGAGSVPRSAVRGITPAETYDVLADRADLSVDRETYVGWYDEVAEAEVYADAPALPGVGDLITDARVAGVAVALVSSAHDRWVEFVLDRVGAAVDATVTGDEDLPGKPDPAPYATAAARLDADPRDCVAVDDSTVGVASARAAGAYVVGYGTDAEDRSAAHERIATPEALIARLRELVGA
jgi:HAD superfamily hydrolase (TIGR01509 family)